MALDPKWSEEARKNVKETSIDKRMYDRMVKQRERIAADREAQDKIKAAATAMPAVPSYSVATQQAPAVVQQKSSTVVPASSPLADELYERLKNRIDAVVREEINALIEEGRLG